jgi:hypothetical protein
MIDTMLAEQNPDATTALPILDAEEQATMDSLDSVMRTITQTWGMSENSAELASAVHVIQGFIVQHMLHRLAPEHWNSWTPQPTESTYPGDGMRT